MDIMDIKVDPIFIYPILNMQSLIVTFYCFDIVIKKFKQ